MPSWLASSGTERQPLIGELQQLEYVPVGIAEGGDPASPMLPLGNTQERNAGRREPRVLGVNIVDPQVRHHPQRVALTRRSRCRAGPR